MVEQHQSFGFAPVSATVPQRLVMAIAGAEKSGKTHFSLTGRRPIFFINMDLGTEGVIEKFVKPEEVETGVFVHRVTVSHLDPNDAGVAARWKEQWNDFRKSVEYAYSQNPGTVVVDTWTEAYRLCRLAQFGKETAMPQQYDVVNAEMKSVTDAAYDAVGATTVLIQKMGLKFGTEEMEVKGWSDTPYRTQMNVISHRDDAKDLDAGRFGGMIRDCRQNPRCHGMVVDGVNFNLQYLEWLVHQWQG